LALARPALPGNQDSF